MRPDYISQMSQSPMLSKLNSPSGEGEAGRSRGHQGRGSNQSNPHSSGGNRQQFRIKISKVKDISNKINIKISSLKEAEGEDQMTKQAYNAITAKSMGTMNLNAGRRNQIISQTEHMCQITREKTQEVCFFCATKLNNNLKISGCWTVDAAIT
jgi:hypothetical protein